MGWLDKLKEIIGGLRESGKNEEEIKDIVQQAADKATVMNRNIGECTSAMKSVGMTARKACDAVDAFSYAVAVHARMEQRQQTNNWRRMHGLPMKRKRSVKKCRNRQR